MNNRSRAEQVTSGGPSRDRQAVTPVQFYSRRTSDGESSMAPRANGAVGIHVSTNSHPGIPSSQFNHLKRPRPNFGAELDLDSEAGSSPKRATSEDPDVPTSDGESLSTKGGPNGGGGGTKKMSNSDPQVDGLLSGPWGVSEEQPITSAISKDIPSRAEQWALISEMKSKLPKVGEKFQLVPQQWWDLFKAYCHDQGSIPDPLSTHGIVDTNGQLKAGLIEGQDVALIPSQASALLSAWYGHQGPQVFRSVIPSGQNQTRIEFYPPTFTIFLLKLTSASLPSDLSTQFNSPLKVTLSCVAPYSSLLQSISIHLGRSSPTFRLWRLPAAQEKQMMSDDTSGSGEILSDKLLEDGAEVIDTPERSDETLTEALLDADSRLAIDIKLAEGKWVSDEAIDNTAQDVPLFEPGTDFVSQLSKRASARTVTKAEPTSPQSESSVPTMHQILTSTASAPASSGGILGAIGNITRSRTGASGPSSSRPRGQTGLQNLGNTCFMNSALQCLSHTKELTYYFLSGVWDQELNPSNPLGMSGQVAEAYGKLLNQLWSGQNNAIAPRQFKQVLSKFKDDFAGYRQHDSQELIAFLLDGLHEDLNRILKKPYVEIPDWKEGDDRTIYDFGKESWNLYRKRNDSIIVDLFQGQYKSTLTCPVCSKISITFDPFMYLTLPLPINKKWRGQVFYIPKDSSKKGVQVTLQLDNNATISDLCKAIADFFHVQSTHLIVAEIYASKFYKYFQSDERLTEIGEKDIIYLFETPGEAPSLRRSFNRKPVAEKDGQSDLIYFPVVSSQASSSDCVGIPLIAWGTFEQLSTPSGIAAAVLDRFQRYVALPNNGSESKADENMADAEDSSTASSSAEDKDSMDLALENGGKTNNRQNHIEMFLIPAEGSLPMPTAWSIDRRRLAPIVSNMAQTSTSLGSRTPPSDDDMLQDTESSSSGILVKQGQGIAVEVSRQMGRDLFFSARNDITTFYDRFEDPSLAQHSGRRKKTVSLEDCLDEFTREEQLGQSDLWYCPQCKEHRQAFKKFDLWKIPDILVVHLKRFGTARAMRDKIDALVDAPVEGLSLDLRSEERVLQRKYDGLSPDDEPLLYDLFAVDNHFGGLGGGHYTAYAKDLDTDTWRNYDDSHVSNVAADSVVTNAAYLLFYRRRTKGSLGSVSWTKTVEAAEKIQAAHQADLDAKRSHAPSSSEAGELSIPGAYSNGSTANSTPLEDDTREAGYGTWDGAFGDHGQWMEKRTNFTFGLGPGRPPVTGPGTRTPSHQSQTDSALEGEVSPVEANHGSGTDVDHPSPGLSDPSSSSSSSSSPGAEPAHFFQHAVSAGTVIPQPDIFPRPSLPSYATHEDGDDEDSHSSIGVKKAPRLGGVQHTYGRSHRKSSHTPIFAYPTTSDGWGINDTSD